MKLSKHQKEIVEKIISREVFDISSYLEVFRKRHIEKYNIPEMRKRFTESEQGKQYKVFKPGFSMYQTIMKKIDLGSLIINSPSTEKRESIPDDEWDLVQAELNERINPQNEKYKGQSFSFNFIEGVFIADSFSDIEDFLSLWAYLRRESLILETHKKIGKRDIEVFFVGKPAKIRDRFRMKINGISDEEDQYITYSPPSRDIVDYSDVEWELCTEQMMICDEFIDKRMYPNSDLRLYAMDKYKTLAEISERKTRLIAFTAIGIALVSAIMGIMSFLTPQYKNDFLELSNQVNNITALLEDGLPEISNGISNIENNMREDSIIISTPQNNTEDVQFNIFRFLREK